MMPATTCDLLWLLSNVRPVALTADSGIPVSRSSSVKSRSNRPLSVGRLNAGLMRSVNSASSSLASFSVAPMKGESPGRIFTSDPERPDATARARISEAKSTASSSR